MSVVAFAHERHSRKPLMTRTFIISLFMKQLEEIAVHALTTVIKRALSEIVNLPFPEMPLSQYTYRTLAATGSLPNPEMEIPHSSCGSRTA